MSLEQIPPDTNAHKPEKGPLEYDDGAIVLLPSHPTPGPPQFQQIHPQAGTLDEPYVEVPQHPEAPEE